MKKIKIILSTVILILVVPILIFSFVILVNSILKPNEVPSFFGWKPFIVLSGSMETEINSGDIAVVKEVDVKEIKENDIIAYNDNGIVTTHRVIEIINEEGITKYKTKGDNNNVEDAGFVLENQIEGKFQFKIAKLGKFAMFVQTPLGMVICLSIPVGLWFLVHTLESKGSKKLQQEAEEKEKELEKKIKELEEKNKELEELKENEGKE